MHRIVLKYLPVLAISIVVLICTGASNAQTSNAWGYTTGYGNVYGTFGLAQTMQTMYNTTRRNLQTSSSSAKPAAQSNSREAPTPQRVVHNYGVFRPDPTVDTGKAMSEALGETADEKALIRQIYTASKAAYEKEAAPKKWQKNIAGGLTFFTAAAMTVYHDAEEPSDAAVQTYYDAVNASLDEMPGLASISNKDKQNYNNMMIGFAGLLLAGYTEGKQSENAATLDNYKKLAGVLITMVLKTDPDNLRMEHGQIVLK
ncbi:MAG: hypothetical protein DMF63_03795 [Acidobacteria bacterium]|nr:MAG: hypothetical protein DMF63_03795 [Acidobacteriota bacterium]